VNLPASPAVSRRAARGRGRPWTPRRLWSLLGGPALFVVVALFVIYGQSGYGLYQASIVLVYCVVALGQEWLTGRAGQISLGAAAFMAIGAFVGARTAQQSWAPFPLPLLAAALAGGLVGIVIGLSSLRFRGLYLALSTLALQFFVQFAALEYQGGNQGGVVPPIPKLFGYEFSEGRPFVILMVVIVGLLLLLLRGMYSRAPGRAWAALRQSEVASAVSGVDVMRWKLAAFAGSSAVIAVGGCLFAYLTGSATYQPYTIYLTVSVLVMVFVGGTGSMVGALLGAVLVGLLPYWIQDIGNEFADNPSVYAWFSVHGATLAIAVYGLALLLVLVFEREGLYGLLRRLWLLLLRGIAFARPQRSEGDAA